MWTTTVTINSFSLTVTFSKLGGVSRFSGLLHPRQAQLRFDIRISLRFGQSVFCLWSIDLTPFLFSSPFNNREGKAEVITGRETAPSRVRQRQACIENENMKITGAGRGGGGRFCAYSYLFCFLSGPYTLFLSWWEQKWFFFEKLKISKVKKI